MNILQWITDTAVRWQYARMARWLSVTAPERIAASGEARLLKAFHRAARRVPAYRRLLEARGVDPAQITNIREFKNKVPILDKETVFASNELRDLCVGADLDGVSLFYSSSGHSGVFSYGVETRQGARRAALAVEFFLDAAFHISRRKTLLINCLPMGVKVHTRTLALAETSVRSDVVLALIRKLKGDFDQFILVGESPFLKMLVEEGCEAGIPWHDLTVHVVTGGEFIAENYRTHLARLLGIDFERPERGMILVSMGISELGLSLFHETPETVRIRRAARDDHTLRDALFGEGCEVCPLVMQYHPQLTFMETVPTESGSPELVVSMLDTGLKIPLLRYNTRDRVHLVSYAAMRETFSDAGYGSLLPPFQLPFGLVSGRSQCLELEGGETVSPDQIKEALYENFDVAWSATGNFRLLEDGRSATLQVQLKRGARATTALLDALAGCVQRYVKAEVGIQLIPCDRFPYGLEHNYEKKNQYLADNRAPQFAPAQETSREHQPSEVGS